MPSVLKIGFAAPLSGDQAIVGLPMARCAELAVARANAAGVFDVPVVLEAADDCADPAIAVTVARAFGSDPAVAGVVGHKNSSPSAAAAPIYDAAGVAMLTPSSTNPALSRQGYRTFFRLCAHDAVQAAVAARYAVQVLQTRRLAVVHDQTDYGQPLAEAFAAAADRQGAAVVGMEGIEIGGREFPDAVRRLQATAPDLVFFALTEIESAALTRQLRATGVQSVLLGTDGGPDSRYPMLAGAAGEGTYHTYAGAILDGAAGAEFAGAFTGRYGPLPPYGGEVYDAATVLLHALRATGRRDREAVLAAVARTDLAGVTGRVRFDPTGDRLDPQVTIWRVERGMMRPVGAGPSGILARR